MFLFHFIMPPPTYDEHIPKALWLQEQDKTSLPIQTKSDYKLKTARFYKALGQIESASTNFKIYPVIDYFCKKKCKIKSDDNMPLYFDTDHFNAYWRENALQFV